MRKIVGFIVAIVALGQVVCAPAIAGTSLPQIVKVNDVLKVDNPAWTGQKYNGSPALYAGNAVGSNINYMTGLSVRAGKVFMRRPGEQTDSVQDGAVFVVTLQGNGDNSFAAFLNSYKSFVIPTMQRFDVALQDSGIVLPAWNHISTLYTDHKLKVENGRTKSFPEWVVYITFSMSIEDYTTKFVPAFDAWQAKYHYFGSPSNNVLSDNGQNGNVLIYKRN